jgi:hypothetical protein
MPNNASARRDKDKKKKDKKKKDNRRTDPPPLHKEDTASADSVSLSPPVIDKAEQETSLALDEMERVIQEHPNRELDKDVGWAWARLSLLIDYSRFTTVEARRDTRRKLCEERTKANPLMSSEELKACLDNAMSIVALEWRRNEPQREKDLILSSALAERKKEEELLVRGPAQNALLAEFDLSLTMAESSNQYVEVKDANPNASAKEIGAALRAFRVQAALT